MHKKMIKKFIKNNWIIILVFFAAFLVRVAGIYPGYTSDHPDEPGSYRTAIHMFYNFLMPGRFDYPAGMPFFHLIIYLVFILPFVLFKLFFPHPDMIFAFFTQGFNFFSQHQEAIFGERNLNALYWSRYIAASFGVGAVVLTYLTAKKLFGKTAGIFAAFFLAFNFRHVLASHFGLPDIHSSFFNMLTLFASILLFEKNTRMRYVFAGLAASLALSIKYQPFAYLPFFVVHFLWALKKRSFWYLFNINFILGMLLSFIAFVAVNPYYLFNINEAMIQNNKDYVRYGMGRLWLRGYQFFYLFHWGIGQLPSIAILLGIISMLFLKFRKFLILFSFVSAFFFVMTYYSSAYTRNFTAVMPYLFIFAGFFIDLLFFRLKRINIRLSIVSIIAIILVINFTSIKNSIILDINFSKPWNFIALSEWTDKNLPQNITVRKYDLGITPEVQLALKNRNVIFKEWDYTNGPNSLAEFQEEGTQFAILDTYTFYFVTYWWSGWTDYTKYFKYSDVPFDYAQNSYFGLTIKELMQYTIHEIYQPWQVQTLKNYLVFKISQKPEDSGKRIAMFTFDNGDDGWKPVNPFDFPPMMGGWVKDVGKNSPGSLTIKSAGDRTQRISSEPIKIKPEMLYTVRGSFKAEKALNPEDRDGYLRIDMYENITEAKGKNLGDVVAVSSRAYENGEWTDGQGSVVAPKNAKYLVISYQRKNSNTTENYLDDVELLETDSIPEEPFKELPYIKPTIPLGSIYYISFL